MKGSRDLNINFDGPLPLVKTVPNPIPNIEISPFSLFDGKENTILDWQRLITDQMGTDDWIITHRATTGLRILKEYLKIKKVSILTTFNTHYISGCVNQAFEGAQIIREISPEADAVVVIHEWGKPYADIERIHELTISRDIPLIEDCALTMRPDLGRIGEYSVFSFPKIFPMSSGGLLRGLNRSSLGIELREKFFEVQTETLGMKFAFHSRYLKENFEKRRENWLYLNGIFKGTNMEPYFKLEESDVPYIYMLSTDKSEELSGILKEFGIEGGVYWKNDGLFIPCHQHLMKDHLDYIAGVILGNIDKCGKNKQ